MRKVRNEEEEIPKSVLKMKQDKERREELKNKGEQGKHSNKNSNKKGAKSKNKKDKHKNRFLRKIILILILILLIVGGIALGISAHNWKVLSEAMFTNKMSVVLDKEGEVIAELGNEQKKLTPVDIEDMPENLVDAYVSIEDEKG